MTSADRLRFRCVFTNTVPTGPYRGAGRPEANYCLERLIECRGAGLRDWPDRTAPPQPDRARPHAVPDAGRHHLRQRRLSGALRGRTRLRRCRALQEAHRASGKAWQAARPRCRLLSRNRRRPARRGRGTGVPGQSRLLLAIGVRRAGRGIRRSTAGLPPSASASRSSASNSRQAIATRACRAPAPSRRARPCRSAARWSRRSTRSSKRAGASRRISSKRPRPISPTVTASSRSPGRTAASRCSNWQSRPAG